MKIFTEKQLAKELGLSYWTIRTWRLQLGLPHIKTGGRIFYRLEAVKSWMEEQEQVSQQAFLADLKRII